MIDDAAVNGLISALYGSMAEGAKLVERLEVIQSPVKTVHHDRALFLIRQLKAEQGYREPAVDTRYDELLGIVESICKRNRQCEKWEEYE